MQCPVCDDRMKEVERQGVMLDICPSCKGVWLDRGELDKLIALSETPERSDDYQRPERPVERRERPDEHYEDRRHHEDRDRYRHGHKRRGSWLGDILESIGGD